MPGACGKSAKPPLGSPDGSAEKGAFADVLAANRAWLVAQIPLGTAQPGKAQGWVPGDDGTGIALPPWPRDHVAPTAIAAARRGNDDAATFLDWPAGLDRNLHVQPVLLDGIDRQQQASLYQDSDATLNLC